MKVIELKGFKSLRALNAYHTLLLGLKMLPTYMHLSYDEFLKGLEILSESDQKKAIREAAQFVNLEKEEIEALICFCADKNGVPYGPENLKNLNPIQIVDIVVAVCFEISKIKIDLVSEAEKKK